MTRAALAIASALALAPALAACDRDDAPLCPGEPVAVLQITGTRTAAACVEGPPGEGGYGAVAPDRLAAFPLAFHVDGATGLAFACTGRREAVPFSGTRTGDAWSVSAETSGAVLGACGAGCTTRVTQRVEGVLGPGGFAGVLTEVQDALDPAPCGACTLPCTATWALEGVPR